jgi:hypothetical protein
MTNPPRMEVRHVVLVDCPWCDTPAPLSDGAAALRCDACGLVLPLAADPAPAPDSVASLPVAA